MSQIDEKALDEWKFSFRVFPKPGVTPIPNDPMESLLFQMTDWAETYDYGIGGGYHKIQSPSSEPGWEFGFGLCVTKDNQLIPQTKANELWKFVIACCEKNSWELTGEFREFTLEEKTFP